MKPFKPFKRVFWVVLDGVGAGQLPDAKNYGDEGSDTLGNLSRSFAQKTGRTLRLPTLEKLGIGAITPMVGISPRGTSKAATGKAAEKSSGKDTNSGHWEMAGLIVETPFATFPKGFPDEIIQKWCKENSLPGVLGNKTASGTDIIDELAQEHITTGKPILYTSADSVWQVAAHETHFGLDRLYAICKSARKICDEIGIGRVIARPFIGDPAKGIPYKRTYHRKDYSQLPFRKTYLDALNQHGIATLGVGKISNIFAAQGIQNNLDTEGNDDGMRVMNAVLDKNTQGLIFNNLIDFDMLYGHRRNILGFGEALEAFDIQLAQLLPKLNEDDLIILTADHGNDPTFKGTDHTREYIPILAHSPRQEKSDIYDLGARSTFGDIGASVYEALTGEKKLPSDYALTGNSFLRQMGL